VIVGIIGAGAIGQAFAKQLLRAGHDVIIGNRRGPDSLSALTQALGPRAKGVTAREAAAAEVVALAVTWDRIEEALADLPPWQNRVLIDATNPLLPPDFRPADLGGRSSSEIVAQLAPGARVVKALNTLRAEVLASDPRQAGGRRVMFLAGDDAAAKETVIGLLDTIGFKPVDLGDLANGGQMQQFPGGRLAGLDLINLA
jgi:predicted dinucleotide-binding enzyme